jgi:hypothetical protein
MEMTEKIPDSVKRGFIGTLDTLFLLLEQERYKEALQFIDEFEDIIKQFKNTVKGMQGLGKEKKKHWYC